MMNPLHPDEINRKAVPTSAGEAIQNWVVRSFPQWVLMASPRHPFLAAVIATVLKRIDDFDAFKHLRNSWSAVIHTTGEEPSTKAILGVVDLHPHRLVNMERDFDIADSIFGPSSRDVYHH